MAKWKLIRQIYGSEEFTFSEGETITVGRGTQNNIVVLSGVVSRNHCEIQVKNNEVFITDLQSANGTYVGKVRIPPNKPYIVQDSNIIGFGFTVELALTNIKDCEKYIFKVVVENNVVDIKSRLKYESDNEFNAIEAQMAELDGEMGFLEHTHSKEKQVSPVLGSKLPLKRKADNVVIKKEKISSINTIDDNIINISDSDQEKLEKPEEIYPKKPKLEPICEEPLHIKSENMLPLDYDFSVKQEYLGYDDEPIAIDSDSDSESEQWLLRLSQSSPGKPFIKMKKTTKSKLQQEESSYSQLDDLSCDEFNNEEEEYLDDIIIIPENPPEQTNLDLDKVSSSYLKEPIPQVNNQGNEDAEFSDDIISISKPPLSVVNEGKHSKDLTDGHPPNKVIEQLEKPLKSPSDSAKKTQMIEPLAKIPRGKLCHVIESKSKSSSRKQNKVDRHSSKKHISSSQKEERKKKLKELTVKDKDSDQKQSIDNSSNCTKAITNVKVTATNRGAFLTDEVQVVVKPVQHKKNANSSKGKRTHSSPKHRQSKDKDSTDDVENIKKNTQKSEKDKKKSSKHKDHNRSETKTHKESENSQAKHETRVPLKSLRPLTDEESFSGKPFSKVQPMQPEKPKKRVRFSDQAPQIHEFEIEPGNRMKKTSLVRTTLVDVRQTPVFSLEKVTLMKILRWNPQWLEEQTNTNDPPPILGHNNTPMTIFHTFVNHNQYVQLIGDLLLMEIWECLTIPYMKIRNQNFGLQMRIESLPPAPAHERCFDLFSFSVNVSVPCTEVKNVPRVGEILLITFGVEEAKTQRFVFVNNVRRLPAPSSNKNSFYSLSLQATFTEKMKFLKQGDQIVGKKLAYINRELLLFEAMEYLAGSPLSDAILKPEPYHFIRNQQNPRFDLKSQWTKILNDSQLLAVNVSVSAALSDKPCIQMVQGPPGTGKSSVICAIVMTYFYNAQGKKQQNRGKILICATSNAAVDGLVIRLLRLRQSLPKQERFRMVRVGRAEAMHPAAANVSSQQLAERDLTRQQAPQDTPVPPPGYHEEISHLEAKINMWKTAAQDAQDPVRVAYCQGRVADLVKRITLMRSGCGRGGVAGEVRPEQLAQAERRIIEYADIVVTTLASAHNHKMRGLKRHIALCIIDEAGQAIEPETLIPLTLDVTKLTLIGDPQQLPGFICSQRAKKHGLSESLFSRLASCTEQWAGGSPVVLLNQQYRMHPAIADYPSRAFYDNRILTVAPRRPDLDIPPYTIVSISSGDKGQGMSGANEMEAWGVSRLVTALDGVLRPHNLHVAVITPYNAHKELIKKNLRTLYSGGEAGVEVNTVDSFQGQERDVVVVSLARSQGLGFLTDAGRMNVMLTRAVHALIICLNPHALLKNHQWRTLVEDAQKRNLYRVLPNKMCQPPNNSQVTNEDILKCLVEQKSSSYHHRR